MLAFGRLARRSLDNWCQSLRNPSNPPESMRLDHCPSRPVALATQEAWARLGLLVPVLGAVKCGSYRHPPAERGQHRRHADSGGGWRRLCIWKDEPNVADRLADLEASEVQSILEAEDQNFRVRMLDAVSGAARARLEQHAGGLEGEPLLGEVRTSPAGVRP